MRVVCSLCTELVDEDEAIKMNHVQTRIMRMGLVEGEFMQIDPIEYTIFETICIECYNTWKEKRNE